MSASNFMPEKVSFVMERVQIIEKMKGENLKLSQLKAEAAEGFNLSDHRHP